MPRLLAAGETSNERDVDSPRWVFEQAWWKNQEPLV